MNFLLHLVGHGKSSAAEGSLRPSQRELLIRAAAAEAADGDFEQAVRRYSQIATEATGRVKEVLTRAHLHFCVREYKIAAHLFAVGMERLLNSCDVSAEAPEVDVMVAEKHSSENKGSRLCGTSLERLIESADQNLRRGRYVRAIEEFQQARTALDTLLSAQGGLILAQARERGVENVSPAPLVELAKLGDLLLCMLARTYLASNLAAGLRERELRDDLAPWATTSGSVNGLLQNEFEMLQSAAEKQPGHAEVHYRLGLVARAIGKLEAAEKALTTVVQLHPHHVLSATRLAATLIQLKKPAAVMPLLAITYTVSACTLKRYQGLAEAASGDSGSFERAVGRLCEDLGAKAASGAVKANLAFALGELGMLDQERAAWREHAASPN